MARPSPILKSSGADQKCAWPRRVSVDVAPWCTCCCKLRNFNLKRVHALSRVSRFLLAFSCKGFFASSYYCIHWVLKTILLDVAELIAYSRKTKLHYTWHANSLNDLARLYTWLRWWMSRAKSSYLNVSFFSTHRYILTIFQSRDRLFGVVAMLIS